MLNRTRFLSLESSPDVLALRLLLPGSSEATTEAFLLWLIKIHYLMERRQRQTYKPEAQ